MSKNITFTAIIMCVVSITTAQTVTLGTFGYSRVDKPATNLNIIGNCFGNGTSTLSEVLPVAQFNGDGFISGADRVIVWNSGTQSYTTYAVFDDSGFGGSTVQWRDADDFYGSAVNPIISVGSAFWIQSTGSSSDSELVISGDVVSSQYSTNDIVAGLQLLSYPFSMEVDLNSTLLKENATGDGFVSGADRIIAWNVAEQTYSAYALFDDSGFGGSTREWRDVNDFYTAAGVISLKLGHGFWLDAQAAFQWVETNAYYNSL